MTDLRPGGFQQLPVVIKNLVIINVLMVLLQFALGARGIVSNMLLDICKALPAA